MGLCLRRCIEPGGCLYACVQAIRWIPVLIILGATCWTYYAYVVVLCISTLENNVQRVLYLFFFHLLLLLFCASYYRTIFSPLHSPPSIFYPDKDCLSELENCERDEQSEQAVLARYVSRNKVPVKTRDFARGIRFCPKCKCIKPDRAHHCSICGQCVLKFDHHCPWVNNCVNFYNYKFFLLFLGYGFLLCLFIFFTDLPFFIEFWTKDYQERNLKVVKVKSEKVAICAVVLSAQVINLGRPTFPSEFLPAAPALGWTFLLGVICRSEENVLLNKNLCRIYSLMLISVEYQQLYKELLVKASKIHLLFLVFVTGMFAISLSFLFFYHLYLTARNRTTVESFRAPILEGGPDKRAFDHGIRANYREVFGYDQRLWFFPVFTSGGDGSVYRTRQSGVYAFEVRSQQLPSDTSTICTAIADSSSSSSVSSPLAAELQQQPLTVVALQSRSQKTPSNASVSVLETV